MKIQKNRQGAKSSYIRTAVRLELDRRRELGEPFKVSEITAALGLSKSMVTAQSSGYVSELADELLSTPINSSESYNVWHRDFTTFRYSLQNTSKALEVIRRFFRLTIEDFHRKGEVTFTKVHSVTGRSTSLLRDELKLWEKETGHKVSKPKTWRDRFRSQQSIEEAACKLVPESRDLIISDLDKRRALAIPFTLADVAKSTLCSIGTVSDHSRFYVGAIAEELLHKAVNTTEEYLAWQREFNTFKYSLRNTWKRHEVIARSLRLAIENLSRQEIPVAYSEVYRITGSNATLINAALEKWEKETGNKADKLTSWKTITLEMVLSIVSPTLRIIPLTFLEAVEMGKPFNSRQLRMIFNLKQPKLRDTAFFVMTFADGNRQNDISFFNTMGRYLTELSLEDIDKIDPDRFYSELHDGKVLPAEKNSIRATFLQTYFRLLRRQNDYFRKLTAHQKSALSQFSLKHVSDDHFWIHSQLHREISNEQKSRRKKATDAVHDKFYLLRDIAERRKIQLIRMHTAYLDAVAHHKKTKCNLPFPFSITDETVLPSGNTIEVRHRFQLWNAKSLRSVHEPIAGDFYERASTYQKGLSGKEDTYFLSYEGGHRENDSNVPEPYWFIELYKINQYDKDANRNFQETHGYRREGIVQVPERFDWDRSIQWWHERLFEDLGLVFIPPHALMRNALAGHAAIQIMTKTGARMNEFLQIRLKSTHLCRVKLAEGRETIAFWAIPKGRKVEEPYYIDERCMTALHAWWTFKSKEGENFEPVQAARSLTDKLEPAPYLWQHRKRHLTHMNINACMRLLLHGLMLRTSEGNSVSLSSHLLRHGFATELRALGTPIDVIALLMKQRDTAVTEYYSQPTPTRLVDLQRRIFETRLDLSRTHIRSPAQIKKQIEVGREKVGALIPVVGGTCTVANECPAKFACMGCAGNAPNPAKRSQVIELKRAYGEMVSMAEAQNLPAERRKALDILASCDDVLAEIDLIEKADRAAGQPVVLIPEKGPYD